MKPSFATLTELSKDLEEGRTTSREIVGDCLDRIRAQDGTFRAFAEVYEEKAILAADGADKLRQAGIVLGPLHGLPIALKDLIEWNGHGCEFGSKSMKGRISKKTATALDRLLRGGMIPLGRTEMVEFAFGGWGANPQRGTPRNPYDLACHRIPGGSSSGSGVAVSSGMCPAAIGSDTGGSVRIPASLTGIVGLKPTYGRISLAGCLSLSPSLDSLGPMTLTVADAALIYYAMQGRDPLDRTTWNVPAVGRNYDRIDIRGRRVAVMAARSYPIEVQPQVEAAYQHVQRILQLAGVVLSELELPLDFAELTALNGTLIAAEAFHVHRNYIHDENAAIGRAVRQRVLSGAAISASDYLTALETRERHVARYRDYMQSFDALLTPAVPFVAPPLEAVDERAAPLAQFSRPANYLATCALSIPVGIDTDGLPLAVQLMGAPYGEEMILALGQAIETGAGPMPRPTPIGRATGGCRHA